jgi:hypothetical protein
MQDRLELVSTGVSGSGSGSVVERSSFVRELYPSRRQLEAGRESLFLRDELRQGSTGTAKKESTESVEFPSLRLMDVCLRREGEDEQR